MLVQIINKVLASITPEDRLRINSRWVAVDYAADWRWAAAFRIAAGIAVVAVLVFLFAFYHNRRMARELGERRRIQAELEQARDRLVRASQEKSELMHMVAHDLRSPLTAMQLGVELLQRDPPMTGPTLASVLVRLRESAGQMARLINDLLSTQNMEEGHYSLHFVAGDALQVAHASVAALRTAAQHKQISVETVLPPKPVDLTTDFVALQQVVDNLLSNALKYSPPGARVELAVAANATHCRFEVRDQGPGVKPAEREKIFEKFGRGSAKPTSGEESIGLGLWIVRRFVLALHGNVWCEPGPRDVGAVFVVEVPLTPPAMIG
jgi:signal transduction histidine kinase